MPAKPLIELDSIDLSRVIVPREELGAYLKQRGSFAMLDGVLHESPELQLVVGFKEIRSDDWWAADHIPGRPLFPGALMVETAAQLGTYDYVRHRSEFGADQFVGFGGLDNTRFRATVTPDCRMIFVAKLQRARARMFTYRTQGFVDGGMVFESDVIGVVV